MSTISLLLRFRSIGVEGEEDIAVLLSYFYDEDTGSELLEEGDGDDGDDGDATELGNVRPRVSCTGAGCLHLFL